MKVTRISATGSWLLQKRPENRAGKELKACLIFGFLKRELLAKLRVYSSARARPRYWLRIRGAFHHRIDMMFSFLMYKDGELILGVKSLIKAQGLSVYADWIDDAGLDRETVTRSTAKVLRERMRASRSLMFGSGITCLKQSRLRSQQCADM